MELSENELMIWTKAIGSYPDAAIDYAFENWDRNGTFFPKPVEILNLIHAYGASPENKFQTCGKCNDGFVITNPDAKPCEYVVRRCECMEKAIVEAKVPAHNCDDACRRRHHRGYGEPDLKWLWKKRMASGKKNWSDADYARALNELDRLRADGAPGWRREA